jgi:parvulin-like peptidyl-prolyl isomerase
MLKKTGSKNKMSRLSILFAAMLIILISCKQQDISKMPVAELKTGKILVADFEKSILENKFGDEIEKAYKSTLEERRDYLKEMIFREIILDLAEINKLDTIKTLKEEFSKKVYSQAIIDGFVQDSISNKIYNEEDVKKNYEQKKIKYFPKHILLDVKKYKDGPAKAKIDSVYQMLKNGEKFEELAKRYSDDIQTGVNGGELGWVFAYDLIKEFEDRVVKMKIGEYTEPFLSQYGYHILLLSDTKTNENLKSFEKEESAVRNDLNKKYSREFNRLFLKTIEVLIEKYEVKIDSANIKLFIKQMRSYSDSVKENEKTDYLDLFTDDEKKLVFTDYCGIRIDANKVISTLKMMPKEKRPVLKGYNDIKMFVIEKIRNKLLENYTDELGYTKKKEYIEDAKSGMYESYKEKIINLFVRSKIVEPTVDELQKYYDDNMETFKNEDGTFKEFIKVKAGISNSIKSKKFSENLKKWKQDKSDQYAVKINYSLLEDTFQNVKDDRK